MNRGKAPRAHPASARCGRICAPLSVLIPSYLILVMSGPKGLRTVWPATVVCGLSFAVTQFLVSNFIGPYLTDILASLAAIVSLVVLLRVWKPSDDVTARGASGMTAGVLLRAWSPYIRSEEHTSELQSP